LPHNNGIADLRSICWEKVDKKIATPEMVWQFRAPNYGALFSAAGIFVSSAFTPADLLAGATASGFSFFAFLNVDSMLSSGLTAGSPHPWMQRTAIAERIAMIDFFTSRDPKGICPYR
jgi:hypothetical protein